MVSQKEFDEGLEKLRTDLSKEITGSINSIKDTVIAQLLEANSKLQEKVENVEERVLVLEHQASLQYSRQLNVVISGIPPEVEHKYLEQIAVKIFNKCNSAKK